MKITHSLWIVGLAVLTLVAPSWGQSVMRDGKEWLQPAAFDGLSWNDVADVCPAPGGLCSGTLSGIDVTGYKWASVDDTNALFNSYGVSPPLGPGPDDSQDQPYELLEEFVDDFTPTIDDFFEVSIIGWSVEEQSPAAAYLPVIGVELAGDGITIIDPVDVYTSSPATKSFQMAGIGAWLYRVPPPLAVPTLTTSGFLFTMLGLLAIVFRRLPRRAVKEG